MRRVVVVLVGLFLCILASGISPLIGFIIGAFSYFAYEDARAGDLNAREARRARRLSKKNPPEIPLATIQRWTPPGYGEGAVTYTYEKRR